MTLRVTAFTCFCLLVFGGCFFDSDSDHITGDYYLIWIDTYRNRSINKKDGEGIVPETVFAVGHQNNFIYAKQLPYYWTRDSVMRDDSIRYYIIERTTNFVQDKPVYGPLIKKSFDSLCRKLNISRVRYEIDYSDEVGNW
jgi:hypothetical protein